MLAVCVIHNLVARARLKRILLSRTQGTYKRISDILLPRDALFSLGRKSAVRAIKRDRSHEGVDNKSFQSRVICEIVRGDGRWK
jgi:hypothetical protein